ncbi:MAG: DNA-binding protein, partial [Haloplanus sp.]
MGLSPTASAAGIVSPAQLADIVPLTDTTVTIAGSVAILILIGLSAFFSSSEIAMFSLARH